MRKYLVFKFEPTLFEDLDNYPNLKEFFRENEREILELDYDVFPTADEAEDFARRVYRNDIKDIVGIYNRMNREWIRYWII